jgi:hypothetical protein
MRTASSLLFFAVVIYAEAVAEAPRKTVKITDAEYVSDGAQVPAVGLAAKARYVFSCDVSYWNAHKDLLGSCEMPEGGARISCCRLRAKAVTSSSHSQARAETI